jgi:chemotaxis signal transduction protein
MSKSQEENVIKFMLGPETANVFVINAETVPEIRRRHACFTEIGHG